MADRHDPVQFIYLDADGITSLYSQITDRLEIEATSIIEKNKGGRVGGKMKLGKALRLLLGFSIDAEAESELTLSKRRTEEIKSTLTAEQKLSLLMRYFAEHENSQLYRHLLPAKIQARQSSGSALIYVTERFDAPQFFGGYAGVEVANEQGAVLFSIGDWGDDGSVIMPASVHKFPRIRDGKMGALSHEAVYLANSSGKGLMLSVFGHLSYLGPYKFQIKPYSISR